VRYAIGASGQWLVVEPEVLRYFDLHRQRRFWQREAGGQLFARFEPAMIRIVEATGPNPADKRGRTYFEPSRSTQQSEIRSRHQLGLHFIGDWHTHAERRPKPSSLDLESMSECFARSTHELNAFVLIIVGLAYGAEGMHVSLHHNGPYLTLRADDRLISGFGS